MEARNLRKERTGVVLSNKMEKTITVAAKFKEKHPIIPRVLLLSRTSFSRLPLMVVCQPSTSVM